MTERRAPKYRRPKSTAPYGAAMTETKLQGEVARYCRDNGALHYHTHRSDRSEAGFPDSVIVGNYLMFRELKSDAEGARPTKDQRIWLGALTDAGYDAGLWYPEDWRSGRIQNEIKRCVRRRPIGLDADALLDLPKMLFLLHSEGSEPAAALQWDAGVKKIDRPRWEQHADLILTEIKNALPRTDEEILIWLAQHGLTANAGPASVLNALRGNLTRTPREGK